MITNTQVTLGTVAQQIVGPSVNPQRVYLDSQETGTSRKAYFGASNISTTNGPHLGARENTYITLNRGEALYAVGDPAGIVLAVLRQTLDDA